MRIPHICLGLLWLAVSVVPAADSGAAARAFTEGRHAEALRLYDEVLAEHPDDTLALLRTGKLLSWDKRFDEALERYDRLLTLKPGDADASLERAKVLSWAGRHDEAAAAFEAYLADHPGDVNARVGMAWLELWSGDPARADAMAGELAREFPDHDDVRELNERTSAARAPWVRTAADRVDDTDDNKLNLYAVRAGWGLPRGIDLTAGVARYEMHDPTGHARIDHAGVDATFRPGRGQQLTLAAGVDRRETTSGDSETDALGGLRWVAGTDRRWRFRAAAERSAVRYNPTITDNGILVDELSAGADGRVGSRWRVRLGAAAGDYSDDNGRLIVTAGFDRTLVERPLRLSAGLDLRWMDFDTDLDSGYFDPQDFSSTLAHLRGEGEIGSRQSGWFSLAAGWQSFTLGGVDTDNDFVVIGAAGWNVRLGGGFDLDLHGEWGDYAGLSAAGFESRQVGLSLGWRGGRTE